ncbi:unnamed protein product, partial [Ostreobium quekettii]
MDAESSLDSLELGPAVATGGGDPLDRRPDAQLQEQDTPTLREDLAAAARENTTKGGPRAHGVNGFEFGQGFVKGNVVLSVETSGAGQREGEESMSCCGGRGEGSGDRSTRKGDAAFAKRGGGVGAGQRFRGGDCGDCEGFGGSTGVGDVGEAKVAHGGHVSRLRQYFESALGGGGEEGRVGEAAASPRVPTVDSVGEAAKAGCPEADDAATGRRAAPVCGQPGRPRGSQDANATERHAGRLAPPQAVFENSSEERASNVERDPAWSEELSGPGATRDADADSSPSADNRPSNRSSASAPLAAMCRQGSGLHEGGSPREGGKYAVGEETCDAAEVWRVILAIEHLIRRSLKVPSGQPLADCDPKSLSSVPDDLMRALE